MPESHELPVRERLVNYAAERIYLAMADHIEVIDGVLLVDKRAAEPDLRAACLALHQSLKPHRDVITEGAQKALATSIRASFKP